MTSPPLFGRDCELAVLMRLLAPDGPRVAYVWGVGGIGKTALVRAFLRAHPELAAEEVDSTALPSDLSALLMRMQAAPLTVLDGLEQRAGLGELLRRQVLGRLPPTARLVVASREPPDPRWAAELGPGAMITVPLERLADPEAAAMLGHWGVQDDLHAGVIDLCHGHPLALVLASQIGDLGAFVRGGFEVAPELVGALVSTAGAAREAPVLRDAFTVCAISRRTTAPMLRAILPHHPPTDVDRAFSTLAQTGWCHRDRDGLYPHGLVRDALRADAKWRDRDHFDGLFAAVAEHAIARLRAAGAPALPDAGFLLIDHPVYCRIAAHRGACLPGPHRVFEDFEAARRLLASVVDPDTVAHVMTWLERQRATLYAIEDDHGEPSELACVLDSDLLFDGTETDDPVVVAARTIASQLGYRPGAELLVSRLAVSVRYGLASPAGNMRIMMMALAMSLNRGGIAGIFSTVGPTALWRPLIEHTRALGHAAEVLGGTMDVFVVGQDLRVRDIAGWLHAQLFPPPMPRPIAVETLDQDEFALALREALRVLADPEALAATRLARTAVALRAALTHAPMEVAPTALGHALRAVLGDAISRLGEPEDRVRLVLERTYVDPAPKQLAAAADLGLSFATYRRALATGVAALTDALWREELAASMAISAGTSPG